MMGPMSTADSGDPRVVLINPRATYANEIAQKCFPPMSLLYLAAALREAGFLPEVIDANALRLRDGDIVERVRAMRPLAVGVSLYSEILRQVHDICRLIRRECGGVSIVLGGPHATAVPDRTLEQFPAVDYVLAGECEDSLPALCNVLAASPHPPAPGPSARRTANVAPSGDEGAGLPTSPPGRGRPAVAGRVRGTAALADVPGLYWRTEDGIATGPPYKLPDVNALPWPARDLVAHGYEERRYYQIMVKRRPVDTLFTSRGCPFHCGFCYNFRFQYRARRADDVVHEIASIRDRGIRDIEVCDDTFTVNEQHALEVFDLIARDGLDVSLRIKSRVDVFTERLARAARGAGVYLVAFGMESGLQRILDAMNKGITVAQCGRACRLTRENGILSHSSWVVGYPGETRETAQETIDFVLKNRPTTANIAVLRPYPETAAYHSARDSGSLAGDWDPLADGMPWVRLPWARERRVLNDLCREMNRRIYFAPHYMLAFAGLILKNSNWVLARYALQEARKMAGAFLMRDSRV